MLRRLLLTLGMLALALPAVSVVGTGTASAGISQRKCVNLDTSNNRRLSVCAKYWVSDSGAPQTRGVVDMHTYILVNGHPVDQMSQTISLNSATLYTSATARVNFGTDHLTQQGTKTCRVNSPTSSQITCSLANLSHVSYFGTAWPAEGPQTSTTVWSVSFRDDTGTGWKWNNVGLTGP